MNQFLNPALNVDFSSCYASVFAEGAMPMTYRQRAYRPGDEHARGVHTFSVRGQAYRNIQTLSGADGISVFSAVMAVCAILISRYTGSKVVSFHSPKLSSAHSPEGDNLMLLPCLVDGERTLKQYVITTAARTKDIYDAFAQSETPDHLPSSNLFIAHSELHGGQFLAEAHDLAMLMKPAAGGLDITIQYAARYFDHTFIQRMQHHFEMVIQHCATPEVSVSAIDILPPEELALLDSFNRSGMPYPYTSVVALFEEQVRNSPEANAIVADDGIYTYRELNEKADSLAHFIVKTCGVRSGDVVAIMTDRSARGVVAMLAIMKAGAAYLPIDPSAPASRKEKMMEQAGVNLLLTDSTYLMDLSFFSGTLFALDLQLEDLDLAPSANYHTISPDALAYVIFTSGSTGQPKGVMVSHDALVNLCQWHTRTFGVTAGSRATLYANVSFDAAVWEVWPYLLAGASVYPVRESLKLNLTDLVQFFEEHSITHCFLPTPICEECCKQRLFRNTEMIILTGGDELRHAGTSGFNVVNNYGPTESTVVATSMFLKNNPHAPLLPIGKPIDNISIFILDEALRQVPVGVEGELCIGGRGLATGYFGQPELTSEKFIQHAVAGSPGNLIYRTGDMACWLDDGHILFRGRKDSQVKIRGYRIELGEIESQIRAHAGINDVKVLISDDCDMPYLCAFYVAGRDVPVSNIKAFLTEQLPDYMIPRHFIAMEKFPLTANGKIDAKALWQLHIPSAENNIEAMPVSGAAGEMISIWRSVLNSASLGLNDNFFTHGGDSIKAIRLIYDVNNAFGVQLKLMDIFKHDTPARLLVKMQADSNPGDHEHRGVVDRMLEDIRTKYLASAPAPDEIEDVYLVADIQLGMLYHGLHDESGAVYHDQIVHQVKYINFQPAKIAEALALMTSRHEILRTAFDLENPARALQVVHRKVNPDYVHRDLSGLTRAQQQSEINTFLVEDRQKPFNVSCPGLWRVRTFALGHDVVVVILICHHAIIDGWSDATFSTELNNTYRRLLDDAAYTLPMLGCRYRDYVRDELVAKNNPAVANFWKQELADFRKTRFAFKLNDNGSVNKVYNEDLGMGLKTQLLAFAQEHTMSARVVCLSVYLEVIRSLAVSEDVVAGLHTHNRPLHKDSEKMLGCFLNSIPLKFKADPADNWLDHVRKVNEKVLRLSENSALSLLEITKLYAQHNGMDENTFFDSLFAYLDFHIYHGLESPGGTFEDTFGLNEVQTPGQGINNTHFNFIVNATLNEFNLLVFYKSTDIDDNLIRHIGGLFKNKLMALLTTPDKAIRDRIAKTANTATIEFKL